ncbi:MAG: hypothetical protein FJ194_20110 [Gammaproteobacteria bacterium]|nr:hypothetical protein [Gammaproteobacteria bacterium]
MRSLIQPESSLRDLVYLLGARLHVIATTGEEKTRRHEESPGLQLADPLEITRTISATDVGRQLIREILGEKFLQWMDFTDLKLLIWIPAIILYPGQVSAETAVWLPLWNNEAIWPERELAARGLSQNIAAVWQDNSVPFIELFLFDGPDLQGTFQRTLRVQTPNKAVPIIISHPPGQPDRTRSLLGWSYATAGRRFSAKELLTTLAIDSFNGLSAVSLGTVSLVGEPAFGWDGYAQFLATQDPQSRIASLLIEWEVLINDVQFGPTVGRIRSTLLLKRSPGAVSITVTGSTTTNIPAPWRNGTNVANPYRWSWHLGTSLLSFTTVCRNLLSALAGTALGIVRIAPGRCLTTPPTEVAALNRTVA